jgi:hypothetical protein
MPIIIHLRSPGVLYTYCGEYVEDGRWIHDSECDVSRCLCRLRGEVTCGICRSVLDTHGDLLQRIGVERYQRSSLTYVRRLDWQEANE